MTDVGEHQIFKEQVAIDLAIEWDAPGSNRTLSA